MPSSRLRRRFRPSSTWPPGGGGGAEGDRLCHQPDHAGSRNRLWAPAQAAGEILKALGYTLEQIAQAIGAVFDLVGDALESFLVDVLGIDADAVEDVLDTIACLIFPPSCFFLDRPSPWGAPLREAPARRAAPIAGRRHVSCP